MALFPKITPCPHLDRFDEITHGNFCSMCRHEVHDLTDMDDAERSAFMAERGGKVCVSQRVAVRPAMAAAALTATAALVMAAAPPPAQQQRQDRHKPRVPRPAAVRQPAFVQVTAGVPVLPVEMVQTTPIPPPKDEARKEPQRPDAPRR